MSAETLGVCLVFQGIGCVYIFAYLAPNFKGFQWFWGPLLLLGVLLGLFWVGWRLRAFK